MLRDTVVTAIVLGSQVAHHQSGQRYLEFLYVNPVTKRLATRDSSDSYLIDGNRLLSLAGESSLTEAVELEFARIRTAGGLAQR